MADPQTRTSIGIGQARSVLGGVLRGDVVLAIGLVCILTFMLIPIPTWLLDIGLSISILFSVFILMLVLSIQKPLEFSTFPTVLLISTALRLGLNISSTRLILGEGHTGEAAAGKVIEAFGGLIIQNNYVVGGIVFAILVIVNFVVVTKGSGRIAEVAARFTLDAMPGKQMAIDSDLSAGLLTEDEAKAKRPGCSKRQQECRPNSHPACRRGEQIHESRHCVCLIGCQIPARVLV